MDGTNSRLITFLAMIAGAEDVTPVEPRTELEYWLNEIAAAKGGNSWKDDAGKFVANRISIKVGEYPNDIFYSLIIDTGFKEFPYNVFKINGEANGCEIYTQNIVGVKDITPLSDEVKNGDMFANPDALIGADAYSFMAAQDEVFPGDPGLIFDNNRTMLLFVKNGDDTLKMQVLMAFAYNDSDHASYNNEADELTFDTFDLKFVKERL